MHAVTLVPCVDSWQSQETTSDAPGDGEFFTRGSIFQAAWTDLFLHCKPRPLPYAARDLCSGTRKQLPALYRLGRSSATSYRYPYQPPRLESRLSMRPLEATTTTSCISMPRRMTTRASRSPPRPDAAPHSTPDV